MDSFELNKVAGAVLGTLLFAFGTGFVAELIYHPKPAGTAGYPLPEPGGGEGGHGGGEAAAPKADSIATRLASADAEKGKAGTKACQACHSFDKGGPNKIGPALWEVVGRKKGSHEGFDYSAGLKEKGGEWTYEDLDHFLENPKGYIKGTKMAFQGIGDPKERANVILYLHTLAESPKPLPEAEKKAEGDKKQEGGKAEGKGESKGDAGKAEGGADAFTAKVAAADPAKGKDGTKPCQACHSFEKGGPNKVGPDLWGVVGRKKAGHEGFDYSAALKEKGGEWTLADLNAFLTKPAEYAKGTKMAFQGIAQEDKRAEVIAYLNTLADNPKPLGGDKKDGAAKPEGKTDDGKTDAGKADEGKKAEGAKPAETKPAEAKSEESKPAEAKPAGAKPEDTPPGGGQKDDPKGEAARPAQGESADTDRPGGSGKAESQGTTGENPPEAKPSGGASDAAPKSGDTPPATESPAQADPSAEKKVEEQKDGGTGEQKPQ